MSAAATHSLSSAKAVASSTFKTFTSSSTDTNNRSSANTSVSRLKSDVAAPAASSGTTIYVNGRDMSPVCTSGSEPGTGTAANPYCSIQDAVDAAASGDTISVANEYPYSYAPFHVSGSDLTILGNGSVVQASTGVGVVLDAVSGVKISGFTVNSPGASVVQVIGSQNTTLDTIDAAAEGSTTSGAISIDGASSGITVSRSIASQAAWYAQGVGISVASGASNIDLASDVTAAFGAAGVEASGVKGLDVVGNTIERSCGSAIFVSGSSTGVSLENNLVEDETAATAFNVAGDSAVCAQDGLAWAPDITVSADSTVGTASDYNDFLMASGTAPYSWAGITYSSIADMQAQTGVDEHDMLEVKEPLAIPTSAMKLSTVPAVLTSGSTAIGAANPSAPGVLSSDLYGVSPYRDSGAVAFTDDNLKPGLILFDVSALGVEASVGDSTGDFPITGYSLNWGDGTVTGVGGDGLVETHDYAAPGTYQVTLTITDERGDSASLAKSVSTAPNDHMVADLTVTDTSALGVTASGAGSTGTDGVATYDYSWGDGTVTNGASATAQHTYTNPGQYTVALTVLDSSADSADTSVAITTAGSDYTPFGPTRVLDTRSGVGAAKGEITPGSAVRVKIGGSAGIPTGLTAVVVNITVTDATGNGFITAYADGGAKPTTSNVNYQKGQTVPNLAVVPVGGDGYIDVYNAGVSGANIDLVADVAGYFTASQASGYTALTPYRLVDTRNGTGVAKGHLGSGGTLSVAVAAALPVGDSYPATAVAVNITATDETGAGVLTTYPDGETTPTASNVNYAGNQNIANAAVIPVGADGKIDIANSMINKAASADVIVDVVGYYSADGRSAYVPTTPSRYLDTRSSTWKDGPLLSGVADYFALPIGLDQYGNVLSGITGFVANATVTQTTTAGVLTDAPDPNTYTAYQNGVAIQPTPPTTSSLNWLKGQTVPNLVQLSTGSTGIVDFWDLGSSGSTALVLDVFGFYQND